jgi:alanine or glycine:cation symporter, AGCS family
MDLIITQLRTIGGFIWGPYFLIPMLVATGVFITIRLRLIQFRGLTHGFALIGGKYDKEKDPGEITHFQALSAALSATIGTGNIAGVATAIVAGGPGAVFWMWVTALLGMSLKFASCTLALMYRQENEDGTISGGPMHYISIGMKQKWLGWLFALFAMIASFGIGNMVQANSVAAPLADNYHVPKLLTGLILAALTGLVIIGGIRRIAQVASRIVPFMSLIYVTGAVVILALFWDKIPGAFAEIFQGAFSGRSAAGGVAGYGVMQAMRFGVARGVFSNESGLGSAPIAHAAARTAEPVREGLVAMLGPLIDTLIICTMTALVILVTGEWKNGLTGATLSSHAFGSALPMFGQAIVSFGLVFFAFSTLISWSYYGDRSAEFIFGPKAVLPYRIFYTLLIPLGAIFKIELVWLFSDITNALMALPNLIALIALSGIVAAVTKDYFKRQFGESTRK